MTRLRTDPVEVRRTDRGAGPEPEQFLWRGRLYVVQEVLARWTQSGGWWRTDAVRALASGEGLAATAPPDPLETAPIPASPKWAQRAWGEPAPDVQAVVSPLGGVDDRERSWWRVEAGRGSAAGTGVFDLCLEESTGAWSLTRVLD
ncbi:MAG TPA: DUF6504 family protein [Mycobacteriales bacterium]|nr:DUF6504 family protein [Mycobacteriales bacterium]